MPGRMDLIRQLQTNPSRQQMNKRHSILLRNILMLSCLVMPLCSLAQNEKREVRNHGCKVVHSDNADDRLKNYPFRQAAEIRLVSFSYLPDSTVYEYRLPELNGKVDLTKMAETVTLNRTQIDSLTHILFDVGYRGKIKFESLTGCYNPRNAILFLDSSGNVFEFVEICFECNRNRISSDRINTGEFCSGKYSLLQDFFLKSGIEFGTIREVRH